MSPLSEQAINPHDGTKGLHVGLPRWIRPQVYRGVCLDCSWRGPDRPNRAHARSDVRNHADEVADEWVLAGRPGMEDR